MSGDWVPPPPQVLIEGQVVYRCADCQGYIEQDAVLWPKEDGRILSITRAYHPDHVPKLEERPHGR